MRLSCQLTPHVHHVQANTEIPMAVQQAFSALVRGCLCRHVWQCALPFLAVQSSEGGEWQQQSQWRQHASHRVTAASFASCKSLGAFPLWSYAPVRSTASELSAKVFTQCPWPCRRCAAEGGMWGNMRIDRGECAALPQSTVPRCSFNALGPAGERRQKEGD